MPSFGSGTGTPIPHAPVPPGSGPGSVMPIPYTLLSLGRYAQIMGIAPAHFMRAVASSCNPIVFPLGNCGSLWPRHSWQNFDQVSHEELALAIQSAEDDIANAIGYFPAPVWFAAEEHKYPAYYERGMFDGGLNYKGQLKSVNLDYGRFVAGGVRAVSLVGTASTLAGSLAYSDEDGDGLEETATIVLATTLTDACEIKVYFSGYSGEQEWEVRPVRSVSISGGLVTIVIDSWYLIDPEQLGAFPDSDGFRAIDICTTANYVTSVEVYREYTTTSSTNPSAEFATGPSLCCTACGGTGCEACEMTYQDGCVYPRNAKLGEVVPSPASWDVTSSAWTIEEWTGCVEPENVKIWYYAGERSDRYMAGKTCDPLSDTWAQVIAWVATARLSRPLCGCANVSTVAEHLSTDLALSQGGQTFFNTLEVLRNPLGTRRGEVMAWRKISKLVEKRPHYAVI